MSFANPAEKFVHYQAFHFRFKVYLNAVLRFFNQIKTDIVAKSRKSAYGGAQNAADVRLAASIGFKSTPIFPPFRAVVDRFS